MPLSEDGKRQYIWSFESQAGSGSVSSYYILGYYPTNPRLNGEFRNIQVTLKEDPTAIMRYRTGYYAAVGRDVVEHSAVSGGPVPVPIFSPEPEYSEEARKAKFQGTVTLSVEVDASGRVRNVNVMRRLGLGLDEKAIEAVQRWRFKPATMGGQPVPMLAEVRVSFRLL